MHQATHAQMLQQAGLDAKALKNQLNQAWSKLVQ